MLDVAELQEDLWHVGPKAFPIDAVVKVNIQMLIKCKEHLPNALICCFVAMLFDDIAL